MEYYKGIPHGSYTAKSKSGILLEKRSFDLGRKDGVHITYFEDGQVRTRAKFKLGVYQEESFEYYPDGSVANQTGYYANGRPHWVKKWNRKGQIYSNEVFTEEGIAFGRPGSKICEPISK